jgi:ribosomal protein S18 acetylase RimI-like enzyme
LPAGPFSLTPYDDLYDSDIAAIIARLDQWFEIEVSHTIGQQLGGDTTLLAVDEATGRAIGFVVVKRIDEQSGRITWAGVDPDHQRRGVGRAMIAHIIEQAADAGLERLRVETMSDSVDYPPFEATRRFYAGLGFEPVRELGDRAGNGLATTDWELGWVGAPA